MKKILFSAILVLTITAASFGMDLALGGGIQYHGTYDMKWKWTPEDEWGTVSDTDLGIFFFLDMKYLELDAMFHYGIVTYSYDNRPDEDGSGLAVELALLGKYPFSFGNFTIYPLLGVTYQFIFFAGGPGFLGGAGFGYALNERLYLRGDLAYGIRFWRDSHADSTFGHGPRVKLGIGYHLKD